MKLTVTEALEKGYTMAFYADEGFQPVLHIDREIDREEINWKRRVVLANIESESPGGIDEETIRDLIADQIEGDHVGETSDDTMEVYTEIKSIPLELFTPIVKEIQKRLSTMAYYKSSGIELIQ